MSRQHRHNGLTGAKAWLVTLCAVAGALIAMPALVAAQSDPLPAWNDGAAKKAIIDFVQATTTGGRRTFVPPAGLRRDDDTAGKPEGIHGKVGTFPQALYDEARAKHWVVISMKNDWKRIFSFEK